MNNLFRPFKGRRILIAGLGESIYRPADILSRGSVQVPECLTPQYAKPTFNLVEPGGMGRGVVEIDVRVTGQPAVVLRLVDIKVIQDNVQCLIRILCDHAVHEVQELPPASPVIMAGVHQSRGHFQGGKEGSGTMALVFVAETPCSLSIGQAQPTLGSLQGLNGGLLVPTEDKGILRRVHVEGNNIGGLPAKFRVSAHASAPAPLQVYAMLPQHSPNLMRRHVSQFFGHQLTGPTAASLRRWSIQLGQNAPPFEWTKQVVHPRSLRHTYSQLCN